MMFLSKWVMAVGSVLIFQGVDLRESQPTNIMECHKGFVAVP